MGGPAQARPDDGHDVVAYRFKGAGHHMLDL